MWSDGALDDGDAEGERLAGSGAGLADEIGAHESDGERHLLDGESVLDADLREGVGDLGHDAQIFERSQGLLEFFIKSWMSCIHSIVRLCRARATLRSYGFPGLCSAAND